jgi:TPR repeat protein
MGCGLRRIAGAAVLAVAAGTVTGAGVAWAAEDTPPVAEALRLYEEKRWSRAFKALLPLAEQGHPRAMLLIGEMLALGTGTVENDEAALEWLDRAADAGFAREATFFAGRHLGEWERDWHAAAPYLQRAAALGHPEAQTMLADMHDTGRGVPRDRVEADRLRRMAADTTNDSWTVYRAARSFLDGREDGSGRDVDRAIELLQRAAEMGHGLAQDDLGAIYLDGELVAADVVEAQRWLEAASLNGVPTAHMRLAKLYLGKGQPRNAMSCWFDAWKSALETDNQELMKEVMSWFVALGLIGHATGSTDILERDKSPQGVCRTEPSAAELAGVLVHQYLKDAGVGE